MEKAITGYPNYIIFDDGRVYSKITNKFLKPSYSGGYLTVELFSERGKSRRILVHRLVAMAFIPNPYNYPQVNHKDENKTNNNVDNLEWCTAKYNMNYGTGNARRRASTDYSKPIYKITAKIACSYCKKPVLQFTKDGEFIARHESAQAAGRKLNCSGGHISECCNGKTYKTVGGFKWRYEREE